MLVMGFFKRHFYILVIAFFFIHTLASQEHYFLNSDVSFLSQLVNNSESRDFYQYFYEVNPPLIAYIYHLFQLPAQLGLLDTVHSLRISMLLYLACVILLLNVILKRLALNHRKVIVVALAFALLFSLPGGFLQREHLILSGCLLYVAMMTARVEQVMLPWQIRSLVTILWALAICLKPQYFLVYCVIELYYVRTIYCQVDSVSFSKRVWLSMLPVVRWENVLIALIGLSYIATVFFYFPAYFEKVVPLAQDNYRGYFKPITYLLLMCGLIFLFTLPSIVYIRKCHNNHFNKILIVVFYTSFLVYITGRAGFAYHLFITFGISLYFLVFSFTLQCKKYKAQRIALLLSILVLGVYQYFSIITIKPINYWQSLVNVIDKRSDAINPVLSEYQAQYIPLYHKIKRLSSPGESILFVNSSMAPANFIRAHLNLTWASSFPVLWSLPNSIKGSGARDSEALAIVRKSLILDLKVKKPEILVIDDSKEKRNLPAAFSYYDFLSTNPEFLLLLSQYKKVDMFTHEDKIKYDIYVRKKE